MKQYIPLLELQNEIVKLMHKYPDEVEALKELMIITEDMQTRNLSTGENT